MHDWILLCITLDWKCGNAIISLKDEDGASKKLLCRGVVKIEVPRLSEWGESVYINNHTIKQNKNRRHCDVVIEMQSGDEIYIMAEECVFDDEKSEI